MFKKTIFSTFALVAILTLAGKQGYAQSTTGRTSGWAARASSVRETQRQVTSTRGAAALEREAKEQEFQVSGSNDVLDRYKEGRRRALIGTWRVNIPESATGLPPFNAFHSFHSGGTFTEVSDLLPSLTESPAFGVWELEGNRFLLTFELFVFDEAKKPAGIIRVRCSLDVVNNELLGDAVVDFIAPDGTEILAIDRSPFTGTRVRPLFPD